MYYGVNFLGYNKGKLIGAAALRVEIPSPPTSHPTPPPTPPRTQGGRGALDFMYSLPECIYILYFLHLLEIQ